MKKLFLTLLLLKIIYPATAQDKAWEITLPDDKQKNGSFTADLNNPQKMYLMGTYTARAFTLDGILGDWIDLGGNANSAYFFSDASHVYAFIHQILGYNYNNFYTYSLLYSSTPGVEKGLKKDILKKERYLDLAAIHMIDGKLYVAMGGGDPFNKRPAKSFIFEVGEDTKIIATKEATFPSMKTEAVVQAKQDKGKFMFSGSWSEVSYDPTGHESVIFRLSSIETGMEAVIFTLDMKNGTVSNEVSLELPDVQGKYVRSVQAGGVTRNGNGEFIVQVFLSTTKDNEIANPAMLILRYDINGSLLGTKLFDFAEFTGYKEKTIVVRKNDMLATVYYDRFSEEYIFIGRQSESYNFQMVALDNELNISKIYPRYSDVSLGKKQKPGGLSNYWADYYGKTAPEIYFGEDFVLVSHYDFDAKKSTVTCYK